MYRQTYNTDKDVELILAQKTYYKPNANTIQGLQQTLGGISYDADIVPMGNFITKVMGQDRNNYIPEPSRYFFAVQDPRPFVKGSLVLVDMMDGRSGLRKVKSVEGKVLWLESPLTAPPMINGDVFIIVAKRSNVNREMR